MKIGIDARMYRSSVAGIGRYSQNLIKNLLEIDKENQYVLFMTPADRQEFKQCLKAQNANVKTIITDIEHYSIAEQTKLPAIIAKEKCDLVHFLSFNFPVRYKGKFIVTIHDLTLFFFPETARETSFIKRLAFRYVMQKACQNSRKIIAVSENTKKDLIKYFKVIPKKVVVIPEAADDKSFTVARPKLINQLREKFKIKKPVILYVGQWRPHKNIAGLIEAFAILKKTLPSTLVIVGKPDPKHKTVTETIDKLGLKSDIVMPGFVSGQELAAWYKIASVFVFPSFYEGFGLPGLEAMAAGIPVVSSDQSSLPEVYQDAAIYFSPSNPQDIADKIKIVLEDKSLRQKLIERGKARISRYSWEKTAKETLKVYNSV